MKSPIEKELERLRYLAATKSLKVFIKYPEYWELMLLTDIPQVACGLTSRSPDFAL